MLTGFYIFINQSRLDHVTSHVLARFASFTLLVLFAFLQNTRKEKNVLRFLRYFFPLLLLGYFYHETDYLNNLIFTKDLDTIISKLEMLIFGMQPSLQFADLWHSSWFAEIMYFGYFSYYLMLAGIPLFFYIRKQFKSSLQTIFIIVTSLLIFYSVFIIFPVAGPQFYFTHQPDLPRGFFFGSLMRFIQDSGEAPTAAFPSSHVSICLILLWICYRSQRILFWWLIPAAIVLILSTVYIRAHYAVDVLAAFLVTPVVYYISFGLSQKLMAKM